MILNIFKELWFQILVAIAFALVFPGIGSFLNPYALYFIIIVLFLTTLKIDNSCLVLALKQLRVISIFMLFTFLAIPIIAFFISFGLSPELKLGAIIVAAMPIGMVTTFLVSRLGGDPCLTLVFTIVATLLCPFLTPLVVQFLAGALIEIDALALFILLAEAIFLPFFFSSLFKRFSPGLTANILKRSKNVNNVLIFLALWGVISPAADHIMQVVLLAPIILSLIAVSFFLGYLIDPKNRMTNATSMFYKNTVLAAVVASHMFGPIVALPAITFTLFQNITISALIFKKESTSKPRPHAP
jgi:BASS family bile acid:Na+ symporter